MAEFFTNHVGQSYLPPAISSMKRWNRDCYRIFKVQYIYPCFFYSSVLTEWVSNTPITTLQFTNPSTFWTTLSGWVTTGPNSSSDIVTGSIITKYPVCTQNLSGEAKVFGRFYSEKGSMGVNLGILKARLYCNDGLTKIAESVWKTTISQPYFSGSIHIIFDIPDASILQGKLVFELESAKNDQMRIHCLEIYLV